MSYELIEYTELPTNLNPNNFIPFFLPQNIKTNYLSPIKIHLGKKYDKLFYCINKTIDNIFFNHVCSINFLSNLDTKSNISSKNFGNINWAFLNIDNFNLLETYNSLLSSIIILKKIKGYACWINDCLNHFKYLKLNIKYTRPEFIMIVKNHLEPMRPIIKYLFEVYMIFACILD